jgi:hypothetical protein
MPPLGYVKTNPGFYISFAVNSIDNQSKDATPWRLWRSVGLRSLF